MGSDMGDKHTPGPWKVDGLDVLLNQDGDREAWCRLYGSQNYYANAHLIAAAPEMLEALRDLLEIAEEYVEQRRVGGLRTHQEEPMLTAARAAIAQATGEKANT